MIQISRYNFHLNEEYDNDIIEFIKNHKNQSRIIRDMLRLAYQAMKSIPTPIPTPKTHTKIDTQKTHTPIVPEKKKPPNDKIKWKIPVN